MSAQQSSPPCYIVLLDPELALDALLELLAFYELLEHDIVLVPAVGDAILLARHSFVEYDSAFQAVVFLARWTIKLAFILVRLVIREHILAVRRWTPRHLSHAQQR